MVRALGVLGTLGFMLSSACSNNLSMWVSTRGSRAALRRGFEGA